MGGRGLPASADDRADGHRDLVRPGRPTPSTRWSTR
jgi:hypothetical protein